MSLKYKKNIYYTYRPYWSVGDFFFVGLSGLNFNHIPYGIVIIIQNMVTDLSSNISSIFISLNGYTFTSTLTSMSVKIIYTACINCFII